MDQRELGELAERAAALAERGVTGGGELGALIHGAARRHGLAPWAVTSMIAREWDRLGIRRLPVQVATMDVPRGTLSARAASRAQ